MINSAKGYLQAIRLPGTVVVRCTAEWCAPCKTIAEKYSNMQMEGVKFYTIDVDKVDDFADVESAKKLPCFFIFKDGRRMGMVVGANLDALKNELIRLQSPQSLQ